MAKANNKFEWDYCECGCHSSFLEIGNLHYYSMAIFDPKWNVVGVWFNRSHPARYGKLLNSYDDVDAEIMKDLKEVEQFITKSKPKRKKK